MIRYFLPLLFPIVATSGCRTVPVAGECPESSELKCLTRKVCTQDTSRGCIVCTCESPFGTEDIPNQDRERGRSPDGRL